MSHLHHHHHRHISIAAIIITITTITLSHLHHNQQSSTILHNGCVGSEVTAMVAVVEAVVMGGLGGAMMVEAAVVGMYAGCGGCDGESVTMCWVIMGDGHGGGEPLQ